MQRAHQLAFLRGGCLAFCSGRAIFLLNGDVMAFGESLFQPVLSVFVLAFEYKYSLGSLGCKIL